MPMEKNSDAGRFEQEAQKAYARFAPLAGRYYYKLRRPVVTGGGTPCMVFLGNHSSGKSSIINWLLGEERVQDVGLAPTDDGFTVIMYGQTSEDVCGPAALARLPAEFAGLKLFGGDFLHRLCVKVRPYELLKSVTLIDTPGMIDSAEHTVNRSYDFEGVVRVFAELCDMVFYLLDPDKPGTTGETVNVFAKCLSGVQFKLRVLLNKCDAFSGMYDFARTYGTVCWNLARVLHTKDLPKIWTIYSGPKRENAGGIDLTDFDRHREEFLAVVRDAAARRRDNVFSQSLSDFLGLSIRMCVVNHAARRIASFAVAASAIWGVMSAAVGFAAWHALLPKFDGRLVPCAAFAGAAVLTAAFGFFATRIAVRSKRHRLAANVDTIFATEYSRTIALGKHDNLRQVWDEIRDETAEVVRSAPLRLPFFGEFLRHRLEKASERLFSAFRRDTQSA